MSFEESRPNKAKFISNLPRHMQPNSLFFEVKPDHVLKFIQMDGGKGHRTSGCCGIYVKPPHIKKRSQVCVIFLFFILIFNFLIFFKVLFEQIKMNLRGPASIQNHETVPRIEKKIMNPAEICTTLRLPTRVSAKRPTFSLFKSKKSSRIIRRSIASMLKKNKVLHRHR